MKVSRSQYLAAFQGSLRFHLGFLFPNRTFDQLAKGEVRDLFNLVCEDVRRHLKLDDLEAAYYKGIAYKALEIAYADQINP